MLSDRLRYKLFLKKKQDIFKNLYICCMKIPVKIFVIFLGAVLYSAAAKGISNSLIHHRQQEQITETAATGSSFSEERPFVNAFAVEESNLTILFVKTAPEASQKKEVYKAAIHAAEAKSSCVVISFNSQLNHFPVRIRKSDMLFPFHYFFDTVLI